MTSHTTDQTMTDRAVAEDQRLYLIDDTIRAAYRLTAAIGWLAVLTVPGREPRPSSRPWSEETAERATAQWYRERAEAWRAGRAGLAGSEHPWSGPSAAPLRIQALAAIEATRPRVARAVAVAAGHPVLVDGWVPWLRPGDPVRAVVEAIDWLAGPGPGWVVDRAGVVRRRCVVDELPADLVERVRADLDRAVGPAEDAAGITDRDLIPFPGGARCPACGRRSLEVDVTVPSERWWVVRCTARGCLCTGAGCGCRQRVRYAGRAHAWPASEFPDLAARLRAQPGAGRVRSGHAGRGW